MDFLQGMNAALDAIEADLRAPVDLKKLGRLAACSPFHFQRMFGCLAGISLSEYVRRRRMTLAAVALKDPRRRVLDVALEFGYDSPTAFSRAFRSVHGIVPSQARMPGVPVKSYPRIRFSIIVKGDKPMEYRIEERPAFRIVGYKTRLRFDVEENFRAVPLFWQEVHKKKRNRAPLCPDGANRGPDGRAGRVRLSGGGKL